MSSTQTNYYALIQNISEGFSAVKNASYSELQILEIVPNNYIKEFVVSPNTRFNIVIVCPNPTSLQLTFFDESGNISFTPLTITNPTLLKFENENFSKIILNDLDPLNHVLLAYNVVSFASPEDVQYAKPSFDLQALPYSNVNAIIENAPTVNANINSGQAITINNPTSSPVNVSGSVNVVNTPSVNVNNTPNVVVTNSTTSPVNVGGTVTVNNSTTNPVNVSGTVTANISSTANQVIVANAATNPVQITGTTTIQAVDSGVVIGSNDTIVVDNVGLSKTVDYGQQTLLFDPLSQVGNWVVLNNTGSLATYVNTDSVYGSCVQLNVPSNSSQTALGIALGNNTVGHNWDFSGFKKASIQIAINPSVLGNLSFVDLRFDTDNSGQLYCPNLNPPPDGSWHVYTFDMSGLSADALSNVRAIYVVLQFNSAVATTGMALFNQLKFFGNIPQYLDQSLGIQHSITNITNAVPTINNSVTGVYYAKVTGFSINTSGNYLAVLITVPPLSFIRIKRVHFFTNVSMYYYTLLDDYGQVSKMWDALSFIPIELAGSTTLFAKGINYNFWLPNTGSAAGSTAPPTWYTPVFSMDVDRGFYNSSATNSVQLYYKMQVGNTTSSTNTVAAILIEYENGSQSWFSNAVQNTGGSGSASSTGGGGGYIIPNKYFP